MEISCYNYISDEKILKSEIYFNERLEDDSHCSEKYFFELNPGQVCLFLYYNNTNFWILDDNFTLFMKVFDSYFLALEYINFIKLKELHNYYLVSYKIINYKDVCKLKIKSIKNTEDYNLI
tara:strand:- start:858 stop:1220 length:363 start_codon:yes stop_codon:yes gene_type:complete